MKTIKQILFSLCLIGTLCTTAISQQYFASPVESFSKKKMAYITMQDGKEVECKFKSMKRSKGLIKEITVWIDEKKKTISASDIKEMYLPQSGLDKLGKVMDFANDATQWESEDINMDHIKDGYSYFIQSSTQISKKKKADVLMQLLNPAFASKVMVFHDPFANESASASVAGIKVAGGNDKSYFIKVGSAAAFKVRKKDYEDYVNTIFADCGVTGSAKTYKWANFGEELMNYTRECNN